MAFSNMYKSMSLLGVAEFHSSCILFAIALEVGPLLGDLPSKAIRGGI